MMTKVHVTKPFMSGRSQAIRIPSEYRIPDDRVVINRIGESLIITPEKSLRAVFFAGLNNLTDDFLADGRPEEILRRVRRAVDDFVGDAEQSDDLTMMVIKRLDR